MLSALTDTAATDGSICSPASDFDGLIAALALGLVPRDLRQMGALRAPVADANVMGPGMPAMAACALPFQLGPDVDVGVGKTATATLYRHLAHHLDAELVPAVCALLAPRATKDIPAHGSPLVPLRTPEVVAGSGIFIVIREALPAMLLRDAAQFPQSVFVAAGVAGRLIPAQSAPFAVHHSRAGGCPLMALATTEAIGVRHQGVGLRQPFATTLARRLLDAGQPRRVAPGIATADERTMPAPVPRQDALASRLELVAEPATKAVRVGDFAVAGGQALAAGLPGDLLQAPELCIGRACGAVDQDAEHAGTVAGHFVPVCAAEPIAGALATL